MRDVRRALSFDRVRATRDSEGDMFKEIGHFIRTGKEVMPLQKQHGRAEFTDIMMAKADTQGYAAVRRELVGDLTGRVLDIGCGTGTMFGYYAAAARVDAIEPGEDFLALAVSKATMCPGTVRATAGDGMNLAFEDGTFDAVVFGLVLCSVPSVTRALEEAFRVLKPGGQLRALEHVRSEAVLPGFLMNVTNPLWLRLNKQGCSWNRDPIASIESTGFRIDDVAAFKRFDTVMPAFPMRRVRAHKGP
jgi:ubiquinone/menaquinone biosynthesis C-methylase UbiE